MTSSSKSLSRAKCAARWCTASLFILTAGLVLGSSTLGCAEILGMDRPTSSNKKKELSESEKLMLQAQEQFANRKFSEAQTLAQKAYELQHAQFGDSEDSETALLLVADAQQAQGQNDQALETLAKVFPTREKRTGIKGYPLVEVLDRQARIHLQNKRFEQAEALQVRALKIRELTQPIDHPMTLRAMVELGQLQMAMCHLDQAANVLERALSVAESHLGANHPKLTALMRTLAMLREAQGNPAAAEQLLLRVSKLSAPTTAVQAVGRAQSLEQLALLHARGQDLTGAAKFREQALELARTWPTMKSSIVLSLVPSLAGTYQDAGDGVRAVELYQKFHIAEYAQKDGAQADEIDPPEYATSGKLEAAAATATAQRCAPGASAKTSERDTLTSRLGPSFQSCFDAMAETKADLDTALLFHVTTDAEKKTRSVRAFTFDGTPVPLVSCMLNQFAAQTKTLGDDLKIIYPVVFKQGKLQTGATQTDEVEDSFVATGLGSLNSSF